MALLAVLATREAEIRRIVVRSQLRQIVPETLSWKTLHKNRAGGVAQVVEHCLASSNPSTALPIPQKRKHLIMYMLKELVRMEWHRKGWGDISLKDFYMILIF
jgi:hypothetical protein